MDRISILTRLWKSVFIIFSSNLSCERCRNFPWRIVFVSFCKFRAELRVLKAISCSSMGKKIWSPIVARIFFYDATVHVRSVRQPMRMAQQQEKKKTQNTRKLHFNGRHIINNFIVNTIRRDRVFCRFNRLCVPLGEAVYLVRATNSRLPVRTKKITQFHELRMQTGYLSIDGTFVLNLKYRVEAELNYGLIFTHILKNFPNGPFALTDHMIHNPPHWMKKNKACHPAPLGHRKQKNVKLDRLSFLSSMVDFIPCDQLMQKAHCETRAQTLKIQV